MPSISLEEYVDGIRCRVQRAIDHKVSVRIELESWGAFIFYCQNCNGVSLNVAITRDELYQAPRYMVLGMLVGRFEEMVNAKS